MKMYNVALDTLKLLLSQDIYCLHYQGKWALMLAALLHINIKDIVKVSLP